MWEWHTKGRHCWTREAVGSCGLLCLLLIRNSASLLWVTVPVSSLINSAPRKRALTWREAPRDGSMKSAEEEEGKKVMIGTKFENIERRKLVEKSKYSISYYTATVWMKYVKKCSSEQCYPVPMHKSFIQAVSASVSTLWSALVSTAWQKPSKVSQFFQQHF